MTRTPRLLLAVLTAVGCLATSVVLAPTAGARSRDVADPAVVLQWNVIAARTIATEAATPVPASGLPFALVQLAVYDAVVAVEGGYRPYLRTRAHPHASAQAAAATAAHTVLRHEFPRSAAALDADYAAFLAGRPHDRALERGRVAGYAAALRLLAARQDDGRSDTATVRLDVPVAPGVWRPTPDARLPMLVPWLGRVDPLLVRSVHDLPTGRPDPLGTPEYRRDLAEVQSLGSASSTVRTATQTATATFWNANVVLQHQAAMRQQVERRGLSLVEAARAFAMLDAAIADALIACWAGKLDHPFWRPVTAIREADTDGDPLTVPDPTWTPLVQTPPYPDHPSGHACVTGAATGTYVHLFGDGRLDLDIASTPAVPVRHYDTAAALDAEAVDARVWLGIHFRRAVVDGNRLGHASADVAAQRFAPRRGHR